MNNLVMDKILGSLPELSEFDLWQFLTFHINVNKKNYIVWYTISLIVNI